MERLLKLILVLALSFVSIHGDISASFPGPQMKDDILDQTINMMSAGRKSPHLKGATEPGAPGDVGGAGAPGWPDFDFDVSPPADEAGQNRVKRKTKKRRGRYGKRHQIARSKNDSPDSTETTTKKSKKKNKNDKDLNEMSKFDLYEPPDKVIGYVEVPKDLYQAHLRPGVIFRIHMSEAILKMQYRSYAQDKDESVIEADVEYLRLTRKVISDEITKFEDLNWLVSWFNNRSDLITEHVCNTRYYAVGIPPTAWTHKEEYMKRLCLFDAVYLDHVPHAVGEDGSLMAAVAPPVLHCDAATCTSVPFIDSLMFEERLPITNVYTVTRCQAACRVHCKNDADCLKRCSDKCIKGY